MALGPIQLAAQGAHDRLSPGEKWRQRKYDHSPPPSVDIEKNISTSPFSFLAYTGTTSPIVSPAYLLL
jgi:hypothetical protein